jgi:hypothetical protein
MIDRSDHAWGSRLIIRPFENTSFHTEMQMQADVHFPTSKHKKRADVSFSGTMSPLRYTEARIWHQAYSALLAECDKLFEELKSEDTKKASKKK